MYAEAHQIDQTELGPGQEEEEGPGGSGSNGPWGLEAGPGLVLSTLYLAMEWILQAPLPNRSVTLPASFLHSSASGPRIFDNHMQLLCRQSVCPSGKLMTELEFALDDFKTPRFCAAMHHVGHCIGRLPTLTRSNFISLCGTVKGAQ